MRLPYWLLRLLPKWDYICPKCRREVKRNSHKCPYCKERFPFPLKVPPKCLKDPEALEEYVHKHIFPKISSWQREYLAQFFTIIFEDGFESGDFSKWNATLASGGTISVDDTVSHCGSYSMKCAMSGSGDSDYAVARKDFTSTNLLYARAYFRLGSLPPSNKGAVVISFADPNADVTIEVLGIYNAAGTYKILLRRTVDGGSTTEIVYGDAISLSANTWYCIELGVSVGSQGWEKVWLNGNLVFNSGTRDNDGIAATRGRIWAGVNGFNVPYIVNWGSSWIEWLDCVVVADEPIGQEFQVSLSSQQDNEQTSNKGTITIGETEYSLPDTATLREGSYTITYTPEYGYQFKQWAVSGSLQVASATANPTTLTVSGEGTLKAVYQAATPRMWKISINSQQHEDYGLGYPVTYVFQIPPNSSNLKAYHKHTLTGSWSQLVEKTSNDFFNGIECVRFDYDDNKAYVSVAFDENSDDIYIKITDADGNRVIIQFIEIANYYDNRKAAVIITADDWDGVYKSYFNTAINLLRSFSLWTTVCACTQGYVNNPPPSSQDWADLQSQVDAGLVEVASHGRKHDELPYDDYDSEIGGSKQDIIDKLSLPWPYKKGNKEYVWAWVEPWGTSDSTQRQKCGYYKYLCDRAGFQQGNVWATWDSTNGLFNRHNPSIVAGDSWEHDLDDLNGLFDNAYNNNGIYHLVFHPSDVSNYGETGWFYQHMDYISERKDVWYVGMGASYAYRYVAVVADLSIQPLPEFMLKQWSEGVYVAHSLKRHRLIKYVERVKVTHVFRKIVRSTELIEDVRDVLNLSIDDISSYKILKMIKRAAVTIGLELGKEINIYECSAAEREAVTLLAAIYAICYLTGGSAVGLNFSIGDKSVSVLKDAPPLTILKEQLERILAKLKEEEPYVGIA